MVGAQPWARTPAARVTAPLSGLRRPPQVLVIILMTSDLPLTLVSTVLLMAAVAWPVFLDVRRRARPGGPRTSQAAQLRLSQPMAFAGPAVLVAAGMGLLVAQKLG